MKCPKCEKDVIVFEGFAGRCKKCNHVEYLDPFISRRIKPIDLKDWFRSEGWAERNGHAIF